MANLADIKRRIKSVKNTQQITKAMKMVAAAKLRKAQEDIIAARPYADRMLGMIARVAAMAPVESHPLFSSTGSTGRVELVVITSDRGLCGGFNNSIIRMADRFIRERDQGTVALHLIGKRAGDHFRRRPTDIVRSEPIGNARLSYDMTLPMAADRIESYLKEDGGADEVYLLYNQFRSALVQEPVLQKVLPMEPEGEAVPEAERREILFEPCIEDVLDGLLPKYVEVQIFRALLESVASEHGARMTAMDAASKSASSMIDSLTLSYNRARQASITKELMEIIGGSEALKG